MSSSANQIITLFKTTSTEPPFVDEVDAAAWVAKLKNGGGVAEFAVVLLRMTHFVLGLVVGGLLSLWFLCFIGLNQRAHTLAHASYASLAITDIFVRLNRTVHYCKAIWSKLRVSFLWYIILLIIHKISDLQPIHTVHVQYFVIQLCNPKNTNIIKNRIQHSNRTLYSYKALQVHMDGSCVGTKDTSTPDFWRLMYMNNL